jgi:ubiquinone/menaquinone biosynthesis C-methylase UbiE
MNQFDSVASIYDLIHGDKSYRAECEILKELIYQYQPAAKTLLDVACGTGSHLEFFDSFDCCGLDLNASLISVAQKKGLNAVCGDMRDFNLHQQFDVITCLFGSIAHNMSFEELVKTFSCFRRHLSSQGIILVEPWLFFGQFKEQIASRIISQDIEVLSKNTVSGQIARMEKVYTVNGNKINSSISIFCFTYLEYIKAAEQAGFVCRHVNQNLEFCNGLLLLNVENKA